jgi:hypothetical protein
MGLMIGTTVIMPIGGAAEATGFDLNNELYALFLKHNIY